MSTSQLGHRVGLAGASTLLGQEILRVLKDRSFPVARLVTFEAEPEDPDLPVLDLSDHMDFAEADEKLAPGSLDVLFLAMRARAKGEEPSFLGRALEAAGMTRETQSSQCLVIDAADALGEVPGGGLNIPGLERPSTAAPSLSFTGVQVSPHPATIVLGSILLRLAARFPVKSCVAQVFFPASEIGPRAIEELQKQTVNLLSFQKIPQKVFGTQLAFNVLARLPGKHASDLATIETRVRLQLRQYLGSRAPVPAVQFSQVAVFYSLAFSVFVELAQPATAEVISSALEGGRITMHRRSDPAPSPVEAAGSGEILLDAVTIDPSNPNGCWIWAVADNIRLAAENAVGIAENLLMPQRLKQ